MDHAIQGVICGNYVKNDSSEFVLIDDDTIKAWIEHYVRLFNVEFVWPSNELLGSLQLLPPFHCVRDPAREVHHR